MIFFSITEMIANFLTEDLVLLRNFSLVHIRIKISIFFTNLNMPANLIKP